MTSTALTLAALALVVIGATLTTKRTMPTATPTTARELYLESRPDTIALALTLFPIVIGAGLLQIAHDWPYLPSVLITGAVALATFEAVRQIHNR